VRILHVVGARPNFVKLAPVHAALRDAGSAEQTVVHTGQHYDESLSASFFRDLELPEPDEHLGVGSGSHAEQTARAMVGVEAAVLRRKPDVVVVYGDVNSTLAAAVACSKLGVAVAHVEAGARSFDRGMPEEVNRVVTDHLSQLLFCHAPSAVEHLRAEGITAGVHLVGDVMLDVLSRSLPRATPAGLAPETLRLAEGTFALATVHRAANTAGADQLAAVLRCAAATGMPVVFPVHPRTRKALAAAGLRPPENVHVIEPVAYLTMLWLERRAAVIVTDSGGVQKEAFWLGVPCLTLRDTTEYPETVAAGWNRLVGLDPEKVRASVAAPRPAGEAPQVYGDGTAAPRIAEVLLAS
jgi:UDP-N-acetylglucosamine 2-epimerase